MYQIRIRFTLPFMDHLLNLLSDATIRFKTQMEGRLKVALRLSRNAIVVVIKFTRGSTVVDFLVMLPMNTTENKLTIRSNLLHELVNNSTESLFMYNPIVVHNPNATILHVNGNQIH